MVTLTDEQAQEVREVLTTFIQAMTEAKVTARPTLADFGDSSVLAWTATDEFIRAYMRAIRLLTPEHTT